MHNKSLITLLCGERNRYCQVSLEISDLTLITCTMDRIKSLYCQLVNVSFNIKINRRHL